jgi:hypothetical protein
MNRLRQIHLYLGCVFAPLLAFFALSGLWQSFFLNNTWHLASTHPRLQHLQSLLLTLHTGRSLKMGDTLSSPALRYFVAAMALSLLLTMLLGIVMAFRFGRGRVASICLVAGIVIPLGLVALTIAKS